MITDFFAAEYRTENIRTDALMYLYDPEGERVAYSSTTDNDNPVWVAKVENSKKLPMQFIPVDNNIPVYRSDGNEESTCDGMILYTTDPVDPTLARPEGVAFVELKNMRKGWIPKAVKQLQTTVKIFKASHPATTLIFQFAYAANSRHPQFHASQKDRMQRFFEETGFHLLIQNTVHIPE